MSGHSNTSNSRNGSEQSSVRHLSSSATMADELQAILTELETLTIEQPRQALAQALRAEAIAREIKDKHSLALLLLHQGQCHYNCSELRPALEKFSAGLRRFSRLRDAFYQAVALTRLGMVHLKLGNLNKALECNGKSLPLYRQAGRPEFIPEINLRAATIHYYQGDTAARIASLKQGMNELQRITDPPDQLLHTKASILNGMGVHYIEMNELKRAIPYLNNALQLYTELGIADGRAIVLGNLGKVKAREGDADTAEDYLFQALELFREAGKIDQVGLTLSTIGMLYFERGSLEQAEMWLNKAKSDLTAHGIDVYLAETWLGLGRVYRASRRFDEALHHLQQALTVARRCGERRKELEVHRELQLLYDELQRPADALRHLKEYTTLEGELSSAEEQRRILESGYGDRLVKARRKREQSAAILDELKSQLAQRQEQARDLYAQLEQNEARLERIRRHIRAALQAPQQAKARHIQNLRVEMTRELGLDSAGSQGRHRRGEANGDDVLARLSCRLTSTEAAICRLLLQGCSSKEIAAALSVAYRTVETHRRNIRKKLGLKPYQNLASHIRNL